MPGSIIKNIKSTRCGWDDKILGKGNSTARGHSHKELQKCLYRSNVEIFRSRQALQDKDQEIKKLQGELAVFLVKQQQETEATGLMEVTEPLEPVEEGTKEVEKKLAKDLLEVEKNDSK